MEGELKKWGLYNFVYGAVFERAVSALIWRETARCGAARAGVLTLRRGTVATPAFMPVATLGAVRGAVSAADLDALGFEMMLANAFHLWLRPGVDVAAAHGGLHGFCGWGRPVLTDSGGFQVFSLKGLRRVSEEGVEFRAPHSGALSFLSPENCMEIQQGLGSDVVMVLDDVAANDGDRTAVAAAMHRSARWARRCRAAFDEAGGGGRGAALFGIVQGGVYDDLRAESAAATVAVGFDGYAVGGLAVGEPAAVRLAVLEAVLPLLPAGRVRYLMGVGLPSDIALAVACGVDLFDCVLPTRNARNGQLFTSAGVLRIRNARWRDDTGAVDEGCGCAVCRVYSKAYLHHLFAVGDMAAARLATLHNLAYYRGLMRRLRAAIENGSVESVVAEEVEKFPPND